MQHRLESGGFLASTNGLASGNHPLEALSHALCEVVERDALALWQVSAPAVRQATRVDLVTVDDADCRAVLDRFEQAGLAAAVWEITSDIGIAAFTCTVVEREDDRLRSLPAASGHGCHPTRAVALLRALTEAAQSRLTTIAGSRDDMRRATYARLRHPDAIQRVRVALAEPERARSFRAAPNFASETFDEDVDWELARLHAAGLTRVIAVDLSRDDLGIPVVRVIVPGLESDPGLSDYVPGRRARAHVAASRATGAS
jgi:ribosomal protein S12 methylthiotransferase accessory factor